MAKSRSIVAHAGRTLSSWTHSFSRSAEQIDELLLAGGGNTFSAETAASVVKNFFFQLVGAGVGVTEDVPCINYKLSLRR